ncbi:alpha/beta fold hydrolase [Proteiniclasticum sp. BAD-10]|jgi:3-oxoadipate enol-lactonase|uniref:Alpha/beta fold hydrolase n=1 Tax=Proteiniclasticum sediminis TaxID=2804028 RepID=A0A941CRY8_9CLOT|nr:alpha/beta fold hydrolase [Proteiniclasticum sediminis]MBR0576514.1 alpha/beta fold hydrolase [Proteiniclasticum sediminis]
MALFHHNDCDLFYEIRGNAASPYGVVFLNGVMASTNSWYALSRPFEDLGFKVLLHDFRGQLKSDKPEGPYTFAQHCEDLLNLLEAVDMPKAHFIGTSYGGEVGMKFAARYPDRVASLSIIDSVSETDPLMESFIDSWIVAAQSGDGERFFNTLAPAIYGGKFMKENLEFLKSRAAATKHVGEAYLNGQIELYKTFKNEVNFTGELPLIKAPTLIICGEEDLLKNPAFSLKLHQGIAGSEYVTLPQCGHVSIFEKPQELGTLLLGFILKQLLPQGLVGLA